MVITLIDGCITDDFFKDGRRPGSYAECCHGKVWSEGDRFERLGGHACEECVTQHTDTFRRN